MIRDLVSIVTPAYNSEKFISQTIDSVLNQTYQNWEMIIVNDCSTDNTLKIIKKYESIDQRIKIIDLKENGGAANAWNVAFEHLDGEYVAFLDSDDLWVEEKLEKQLMFMIDNKYVFTFTAYDWINEQSIDLNKIIRPSKSKNFSQTMMNTNIGLLTVMIDRKVFSKLYIKNIKLNWDYYLWASLLQDGGKAYGYNRVLAHYRIVNNSASRNKIKHSLGVWNLYTKELNITYMKGVFYFLCYVVNSVKRYYGGNI